MVKTYRLLSTFLLCMVAGNDISMLGETDKPQATGLLTVELTESLFRYLSFHTVEG